jgi:hypothetical protein
MRHRLQPLLKWSVFDTPYQKLQLQVEELSVQCGTKGGIFGQNGEQSGIELGSCNVSMAASAHEGVLQRFVTESLRTQEHVSKSGTFVESVTKQRV